MERRQPIGERARVSVERSEDKFGEWGRGHGMRS
jgi:hypothetical protein